MPTVATEGVLLTHDPPPLGSKNSVSEPTHNGLMPMMGPGDGFTVTTAVAAQPEPKV